MWHSWNPPPDWVTSEVKDSLRIVASGPGNWCSHEDLYQLQAAFGLRCSFRSLDLCSKAAQVRVLCTDRIGLSLQSSIEDLQSVRSAILSSDFMQNTCRCHAWHSKAFIVQLFTSLDELETTVGGIGAIKATHAVGCKEQTNQQEQWRKQCQAAAYKAFLARDVQVPEHRLREKLGRWELSNRAKHVNVPGTMRQNNPGWHARRCGWLLRRLAYVTPPRVQAAVFSTIWNRWTTERRFQRSGPCLLCGACGGDSIEHYCRCCVTQSACRGILNCSPDIFATLHTFVLATPLLVNRSCLVVAGLLVYATYTTVNAIRHGSKKPVGVNTAIQAVSQAVREGAKGHCLATTVLRGRWATTQTNDQPLPERPLQPFSDETQRWRNLSQDNSRRIRRRLL